MVYIGMALRISAHMSGEERGEERARSLTLPKAVLVEQIIDTPRLNKEDTVEKSTPLLTGP